MEDFAAGDVRTAARGAWLFDRIVETGSVVLRAVGGDEAGTAAAHRYLGSPHADAGQIVRALGARTAQACAGRHVVAVQDTTEIGFRATAAGRHGLGPTGNGRNPGFFLHPVVAVDAEAGAVLGVADAGLWTRDSARVSARHGRQVEDKESHRWIAGTHGAAARLLGSASSLLVVADQEGDLYSHFARVPAGSDVLVRARHDRALADGGHLRARAATWPILTRLRVDVPARPGKPARQAEVALRAGAVEVARPRHGPAGEPESLRLHLVVAEEVAPAEQEPLCWRLLTTRPVRGAEEACAIVRLYRLRWRVEEVFRTLKRDGLGLDATQIRVPDKLFRLAALALGAAVRILQLVDARDGSSRPMQDVLDRDSLPVVAALGRAREGSTPRLKNPHPAGSLAWLSWIVARHGGWNVAGRPPGPKTMARGWQRFAATLAGALLTQTNGDANACTP